MLLVIDGVIYVLGGWVNERKDGPLNRWSPANIMVAATIKFAIASDCLENQNDNVDGDVEGEDESADEEDNS